MGFSDEIPGSRKRGASRNGRGSARSGHDIFPVIFIVIYRIRENTDVQTDNDKRVCIGTTVGRLTASNRVGNVMAIFDETYRVIAVESQALTIQGNVSGEVLTITNPEPEIPFTAEEYPVGQLIGLTDPSESAAN